jgi:uncharacterized protein (DUF427 family)
MPALPDRPIRIEHNPRPVSVHFNGQRLASTTRALSLYEGSYPAVLYIPREDVDMSLLTRTAHTTHCPYKGDAAYYSVQVGAREEANAVWTYEQPFPRVEAIKDYLAFYPDRVEIKQD